MSLAQPSRPPNKRRFLALSLSLTLSALLMACGAQPDNAKSADKPATETKPAVSADAVRVGSKIDTEGGLLGNIIVQVLNDKGIPTVNKVELGATKVVRGALEANEIDIYPEYTGNGAFMFADEKNPAWKDAKAGYELVKNWTLIKIKSSGYNPHLRTTLGRLLCAKMWQLPTNSNHWMICPNGLVQVASSNWRPPLSLSSVPMLCLRLKKPMALNSNKTIL